MTDGQNLAVSNAGEGRIIYNGLTNQFEASVNGGGYAGLLPLTLQNAYDGGGAGLGRHRPTGAGMAFTPGLRAKACKTGHVAQAADRSVKDS
jgi:hypothetical protein